jgi:hypothetical protein
MVAQAAATALQAVTGQHPRAAMAVPGQRTSRLLGLWHAVAVAVVEVEHPV